MGIPNFMCEKAVETLEEAAECLEEIRRYGTAQEIDRVYKDAKRVLKDIKFWRG